MVKPAVKKTNKLDRLSIKATEWVGTPASLVMHTILFVSIFILNIFGLDFDTLLLVLTTAVSLEAIYLAIFIQMTVNRNTESLESVEEDIEDIQEDVQGLEDDVEDITEDISDEERAHQALINIETRMKNMQEDLEVLKKREHFEQNKQP
ncbi:DUF1003 domain-containing protein [Candidatus Daviesbacteria bacterium]|nr:DUF1003 domain-containing protein [Candidatus Daviesbacteria bacterium]